MNCIKAPWRHSPFAGSSVGSAASLPPTLSKLPEKFGWALELGDDRRIGQMLASAIYNGCLLSPQSWQPWVDGLSDFGEDGQLVWVELRQVSSSETDCQQKAMRWFADPVTRDLLLKWRDAGSVQSNLSAAKCLDLFLTHGTNRLTAANGDVDTRTLFVQVSTMRWRLRAPPLLVEHALGLLPAMAIPRSAWERLLGQTPAARDVRRAALTRPRKENWYRAYKRSAPDEHDVFRKSAVRWRQGKFTYLGRKRFCAARLNLLLWKAKSPGRATLLRWCISELRIKRPRPNPVGYAPYTVEQNLITVLRGIYPKTSDKPGFRIDPNTLIIDSLAALERVSSRQQKKQIADAARRLGVYLNAGRTEESLPAGNSALASLTFRHASVWADLVAPSVYRKALATAERSQQRELSLMLTLAFRAGLRAPEIMGLRVGDFIIADDVVELHVQPNRFRNLKTFMSRRIIPLDVLLEQEELRLLLEWLRPRRTQALLEGKDLLCFGPPLATRPYDPDEKAAELSTILNNANGAGERIDFAHLRHSFGSYLLATLLLPSGGDEALIPVSLKEVVSMERRGRVADRLLGQQRLGQAALHAVSQLMGHTGVHRTLESYQHLLDLSLGFFVNRPVDDILARGALEPDQPRPGQSNGDAQDALPKVIAISTSDYRVQTGGRRSRPDWSTVYQVVTASSADALGFCEDLGIGPERYRNWRRRYEQILRRCFKQSTLKEHVSRPQGNEAWNVLNVMWGNLPDRLNARERSLIVTFLGKFDPSRSIVRFVTARDACDFHSFLARCGVDERDMFVCKSAEYRTLTQRTPHRRDRLLWTPSSVDQVKQQEEAGKKPIRTVFSFRRPTFVDEERDMDYKVKSNLQVNFAYRFCLMMLAISDDIPVPAPRPRRSKAADAK